MSSKILSFFVTVLAAKVIQNVPVTEEHLPMLSCMEINSVPLVSLRVICEHYINSQLWVNCTTFHHSQENIMWKIHMLFSISYSHLGTENGKRDLPFGTTCASIVFMLWVAPQIETKYILIFDEFLTIGLSKEECKTSWRDCTYSFHVRADVAALPLFTSSPDEAQFWNFSSPVFRPGLGWLQVLDAEGTFQGHYPTALPGLAGSSLANITLKGSFGSDVKGQLPHLNNLPGLKSLIITNNPMTDLTPDDLANTTHIRTLHLLQNKFHKVPTGIAQLRDLTELVFEPISKNFVFHSETLSGLKSLKILHLSGTNITRWPGKFLNLSILEELNLNRCSLKSFSAEFSNFPKLRLLTVSDNLLTSLSSKAFKGLYKLALVDLSQNLLTSLPTQIFKGLVELIRIDLSQNFLKELPPNIFIHDNTQLRIMFVNLSHNRIALFSEEACASLSASQEVDIGSNIIDCSDCKASTLQHWLGVTKTIVKNVGQNQPILCSQPPSLKGSLVQLMDYESCYNPGRFLWLGIGAPVAAVVVFFVVGGLCFYYRTEVLYFAHLAKVRATSKNKQKETEQKAAYDAFVCYSGKNRKWVMRRLVPLLERRPENYSLCLFDRDFRLGTHIVNNIVDGIDHSRKVIVVLTQHFIDSKWCQWELEMAQHKLFSEDREFLVLLELEPLERRRLPRLLRFLLDTRPVVRWPRPETAPAVMAAAAELRAVLGPSLRQNLFADPPAGDEPWPSSSAEDKLVLVANESGVANDSSN